MTAADEDSRPGPGAGAVDKTMNVVNSTVDALELVAAMTWDTWWALVLGFTLSGAVEAFVSEETMSAVLGGDGWREVGLGAALGVASSSCSYSAVGTTKTLFTKGASGVASLGAFMFASTDLVVELGLVLWVLLGWQFVVGEYLGGLVAVAVLAVAFKHVVPDAWVEAAREHARETDETVCATCDVAVDPGDPETVVDEATARPADDPVYFCCGGCRRVYRARRGEGRGGGGDGSDGDGGDGDAGGSSVAALADRLCSVDGWRSAARASMKDWEMVWRDVALGFLIAGAVGGFVPGAWWTALFPSEGTLIGVVGATLVAIAIGVVTSMCSVGNVPFALVLWQHGLPYGAVLSFVYADLVIPPLVNIYRKYYGIRMAATLTLALATAAAVAGVAIHYVAGGLGIVPPTGTVGGTVPGTYTLVLNLVFTPVFAFQVVATYGWSTVRERVTGGLARSVALARSTVRDAGHAVELATGAVAAALADPAAVRDTFEGTDRPTAEIREHWSRGSRGFDSVRAAVAGTGSAVAAWGYRLAVRLATSRFPAATADAGGEATDRGIDGETTDRAIGDETPDAATDGSD